MYRLINPTSSFASYPTDLGYSRPQYSARDRYLASVAEANAAKAEYLAAQAAQREEEAILRRLEELQLQRQRDELVRTRSVPRRSHYGYEDSPFLRRDLDHEDVAPAVYARKRQQELELELLRRRQIEEAELLALKRKEEEQKLRELTRLREAEEARLLALRRSQAARSIENKASKCHPRDSDQSPIDELLNQLLARPSSQSKAPSKSSVARQVAPASIPSSETEALEQLFTHYIQNLRPQQSKEETLKKEEPKTVGPSAARKPVSAPRLHPTLQEPLFRILFNSDSSAPASGSNQPRQKSTAASPTPQDAQKPAEVKKAVPAPTPSLSLKEQLESRLNHDQSVEIRDTIQAILSSLSDSPSSSSGNASTSTSSATPASSSSKGKGKAPESEAALESSTSNDVVKALETIRTIEASFTALQDEFEFPTQLDFSPSSSRSSSPARDEPVSPTYSMSSDSESMARKLAYTARNHPVRFYEQALTKLLAQLDEVESHGNEDVRASRKAAVARVEGALEELEQKVESRWRKWSEKDTRPSRDNVENAPVEVESVNATASESPAEETSPTPAEDTVLSSESDLASLEVVEIPEVVERPESSAHNVDAPGPQLDEASSAPAEDTILSSTSDIASLEVAEAPEVVEQPQSSAHHVNVSSTQPLHEPEQSSNAEPETETEHTDTKDQEGDVVQGADSRSETESDHDALEPDDVDDILQPSSSSYPPAPSSSDTVSSESVEAPFSAGDESDADAEVLDNDTFLLDGESADTVVSQRKDRDSEDDWSEVEA